MEFDDTLIGTHCGSLNFIWANSCEVRKVTSETSGSPFYVKKIMAHGSSVGHTHVRMPSSCACCEWSWTMAESLGRVGMDGGGSRGRGEIEEGATRAGFWMDVINHQMWSSTKKTTGLKICRRRVNPNILSLSRLQLTWYSTWVWWFLLRSGSGEEAGEAKPRASEGTEATRGGGFAVYVTTPPSPHASFRLK